MKLNIIGTIAVLICAYLLPVGTATAQQCTVTGSSLSQAKTNYARQCSQPRRDCDPVNGQWACSSGNITSSTNLNSGGSSGGSTGGSSSGGFPSYARNRQPWSDSYSVGGQCYCDTTYDHGVANIRVSTPAGSRTVRQVCDAVRGQRGSGAISGRVYYNTVQCGHQPRNTAADERVCPGIPIANGRYTGAYCQSKGATWNVASLFGSSGGSTGGSTGSNSNGACSATGSNLSQAKTNYSRQCSLPRRDCDPRNGGWICSSSNL